MSVERNQILFLTRAARFKHLYSEQWFVFTIEDSKFILQQFRKTAKPWRARANAHRGRWAAPHRPQWVLDQAPSALVLSHTMANFYLSHWEEQKPPRHIFFFALFKTQKFKKNKTKQKRNKTKPFPTYLYPVIVFFRSLALKIVKSKYIVF